LGLKLRAPKRRPSLSKRSSSSSISIILSSGEVDLELSCETIEGEETLECFAFNDSAKFPEAARLAASDSASRSAATLAA